MCYWRLSNWAQAFVVLALFCATSALYAADPQDGPQTLPDVLRPFWQLLEPDAPPYLLEAAVQLTVDGNAQQVHLSLAKCSASQYDLQIEHDAFALILQRRDDETALVLPRHGVTFWGRGPVDPQDQLSARAALTRLISARTEVSRFVQLLAAADPSTAALVLAGVWALEPAGPQRWKSAARLELAAPGAGQLTVEGEGFSVQLAMKAPRELQPARRIPVDGQWRDVELPRLELERQLARGVRRALEIVAPARQLTHPAQQPRRDEHGELRWVDGHRVVLLHGTPEQIGTAHGRLLRDESMACVDSVLNAFGSVETIRSGKWFPHELQQAYARLKPHIPTRHLMETRALAQALQLDLDTVEALNVFPEMFHCSGFALFGSATADGKLYHGRVLDYMTEIGLQDAATTFIIQADGQIPFANVGYAGFIGSVSGMNAQCVSLGEMGGRGEGQWDGVPMATLMRRALEECRTLDEVMDLWARSPRTCEYYYVFADGKSNQAVGVAATPASIQFVLPGHSHPLLGEGIADSVLLSAGQRLETLRAGQAVSRPVRCPTGHVVDEPAGRHALEPAQRPVRARRRHPVRRQRRSPTPGRRVPLRQAAAEIAAGRDGAVRRKVARLSESCLGSPSHDNVMHQTDAASAFDFQPAVGRRSKAASSRQQSRTMSSKNFK